MSRRESWNFVSRCVSLNSFESTQKKQCVSPKPSVTSFTSCEIISQITSRATLKESASTFKAFSATSATHGYVKV